MEMKSPLTLCGLLCKQMKPESKDTEHNTLDLC